MATKPITGSIPLCWPCFGPGPCSRRQQQEPSRLYPLWTLDGCLHDHGDGTSSICLCVTAELLRGSGLCAELELDVLVGRRLALLPTTAAPAAPLVCNGACTYCRPRTAGR